MLVPDVELKSRIDEYLLSRQRQWIEMCSFWVKNLVNWQVRCFTNAMNGCGCHVFHKFLQGPRCLTSFNVFEMDTLRSVSNYLFGEIIIVYLLVLDFKFKAYLCFLQHQIANANSSWMPITSFDCKKGPFGGFQNYTQNMQGRPCEIRISGFNYLVNEHIQVQHYQQLEYHWLDNVKSKS